MGTWLSVFPTVETLTAQGLAALVVLGSYAGASRFGRRKTAASSPDSEAMTTIHPVPHSAR
jgi:hypothetical protein